MLILKPYLALGLLGHFEPDEDFFGVLDKFVHYYRDHGRRLCILLALLTKEHNRIADRLFDLKRTYRDFRLELVIDQVQRRQFDREARSVVSRNRNRLIESADHVYIIGEYLPELVFLKMQFFFATHADVILYATFSEMEYGCKKLESQPDLPSFLLWSLRSTRRLRNTSQRRIFYRSIDFIRSRQFKVRSDEIPDDLLAAWIADDITTISHHAGSRGPQAELLRILDPYMDLLPLTVFAYAFSIYNDLFSFGFSQYRDIKTRFIQYQTLLHSVADAKRAVRPVDRFDVFDFGRYNAYVERIVSSKE